MNIAATLLQPPQKKDMLLQDKFGALAYVISIEKVISRTDAVIVRISSIQRKSAEDMGEFQW